MRKKNVFIILTRGIEPGESRPMSVDTYFPSLTLKTPIVTVTLLVSGSLLRGNEQELSHPNVQ